MKKVVIVTGGCKGLGYEIAKKFLVNGSKVVIVSRNKETGRKAEAELSIYGECKYISADVTVEEECKNVVDQVVDLYGSIEVLVNNAAYIGRRKPEEHLNAILDADLEKLNYSLAVNLTGVLTMTKYVSRVMVDSKTGVIINVASVASKLAIWSMPEYCISKAGLSMLTRCTALELAGYGIRCVCVMPGDFQTTEKEYLNYFEKEYLETNYLTGMLNKKKVVDVIYAISKEEMTCVNGSEIFVDDGYSIFKGTFGKINDPFLGYSFRRKLEALLKDYSEVLIFATVNIETTKRVIDIVKQYHKRVSIFSNIHFEKQLQECVEEKKIFTYRSNEHMKFEDLEAEIGNIKESLKPDCILIPYTNKRDYKNVYDIAKSFECDIYWLGIDGRIEKDINK